MLKRIYIQRWLNFKVMLIFHFFDAWLISIHHRACQLRWQSLIQRFNLRLLLRDDRLKARVPLFVPNSLFFASQVDFFEIRALRWGITELGPIWKLNHIFILRQLVLPLRKNWGLSSINSIVTLVGIDWGKRERLHQVTGPVDVHLGRIELFLKFGRVLLLNSGRVHLLPKTWRGFWALIFYLRQRESRAKVLKLKLRGLLKSCLHKTLVLIHILF